MDFKEFMIKLFALIKLAVGSIVAGVLSMGVIGLVAKLLFKAFLFGFNLL